MIIFIKQEFALQIADDGNQILQNAGRNQIIDFERFAKKLIPIYQKKAIPQEFGSLVQKLKDDSISERKINYILFNFICIFNFNCIFLFNF